MPQNIASLHGLKRPKILIAAAQSCLRNHNRNRILRCVFQHDIMPPPGTALTRLMEHETEIDAARRAGEVTYSPRRHIEVLAALMTEAMLAAESS